MSDVSIPGVSSKYGTEKTIESLMKLERIPRDNAQTRLEAMQTEKTAWLDVNQRFSGLRESARTLFSFKNPFSERVATSSDDGVLTATATREAIEETKSILVKQAATADRFLSDRLPKDYKVPAGEYLFTVGEKSLKLNYGGGSLKDFADTLNRKNPELLRSRVIAATSDTNTLVIEAVSTGSKNRLGFSGRAETLALDSGMVERAKTSRKDLAPESAQPWKDVLDRNKVRALDGALSVAPLSEALLPVSPAVDVAGLSLEFEISVRRLPEDLNEPLPPAGPSIPGTGTMDFGGLTVRSAPSAVDLPSWSPPERPQRVDDLNVVSIVDGSGKAVPLAAIADTEGFQTVRVRLSDYLSSLGGLAVRNANTHREVSVRNARVFDPAETGGLKPKNAADTAGDAVIVMDGVEITRQGNKIDDLIPGVTLNVADASEKPVKLKVEPDRKGAKDAVIEMIGKYNRLMAEINILTRTDEKILSEIDYFTDAERKTYGKRLGLFQNDMTLSQLKSSLQRIVSDPYPARTGNVLLSGFGISTDTRRPGGGYDNSKLRGYVEIDEPGLDKALKENFEFVKAAFGNDTDGDLVIDSGAAFRLDALMKPFVETGGILSLKTRTLDDRIGTQKRTIEDLDKQLVRKEQDLKRKYGIMEGALDQMERSSGSWDNFSKQNQ